MAKLRHSRALGQKWLTSALVLSMLFMLTVVLLVLLAMGLFSLPRDDEHSLQHDLRSFRRQITERHNRTEGEAEQWTEIISWQPRAFLIHNFLSKAECEYLINLAKPHMKKSHVIDRETGGSKKSSVRTSSGTFLRRGQDEIIRGIEKRIAELSFIPVEHGEGLHVIHYGVGQKYEPHPDFFIDKFNVQNGGNRMATLLMYLSDVEEGGETVFPHAMGDFTSIPWWNELSECGKGGLSIKPKRGNALLFWSMKLDTTLDAFSLHGACPVIRGNKWSCTKWMHVYEYK